MKQVLALLFLVTQVTYCSTFEVTESKDITVQTGDIVTIKLRENPTTGYSWQMDIPETDIVEVQENRYIAPNTNLVGAGGERQCVIKAQKAGTVKITGTYRRRWEKNTPSATPDFECEITVEQPIS